MKKNTNNTKCYVYYCKETVKERDMKVGETGNLEMRQNMLWSNERISVTRYVSFKGTKDERLFIESYLRSKYSANCNLQHYGNDHFTARNKNNLKGAENKFFVYVAEAFAILEQIKNKPFKFTCYTGRFSRYNDYSERLHELVEED